MKILNVQDMEAWKRLEPAKAVLVYEILNKSRYERIIDKLLVFPFLVELSDRWEHRYVIHNILDEMLEKASHKTDCKNESQRSDKT